MTLLTLLRPHVTQSTTAVTSSSSAAYSDVAASVRSISAAGSATRSGVLAAIRAAVSSGIARISDAIAALRPVFASATVTLPTPAPSSQVSIVVFDTPARFSLAVDLEFPVSFTVAADTAAAAIAGAIVFPPVVWEATDL